MRADDRDVSDGLVFCIAVIRGHGVWDIIKIIFEYSFLHGYTPGPTLGACPLQHLILTKHQNILNSLNLI